MSKRGEKEDVLAEEDVNQTGGCEAPLDEVTFEVSVKDDWVRNVIRLWAQLWQETWTDNECIRDFCFFWGGGGGVHWFSWSPCWLFCLWPNCWIDRLIFRSAVSRSFILRSSLMCNPDSHSPAGFECQRGNPAWRLFWYCWTVSWKTFLLGEWGCSGFRAVGFPAEAPHLIGAVKSVEGLRMCRVSPFYVFKQNRVDLKGDRWRLKQHRDKSTLECEEGIEIFAFRAVSHIYSAWCYKHKLIVCTFWMSCCWPTLTAFTDFFCPAVWVGAQIGIRLNKWNQ